LNDTVHARIEALRKKGDSIITPNNYVSDQEVVALYNGAVALVHPALYEGFGITPLEAMACGTPTLVSNVEPMPEVANGAAILFDPRKPVSIKNAMVQVVSDVKLRKQTEVLLGDAEDD
jgi:glycosyltransferase involved in cell wall biosynthesis